MAHFTAGMAKMVKKWPFLPFFGQFLAVFDRRKGILAKILVSNFQIRTPFGVGFEAFLDQTRRQMAKYFRKFHFLGILGKIFRLCLDSFLNLVPGPPRGMKFRKSRRSQFFAIFVNFAENSTQTTILKNCRCFCFLKLITFAVLDSELNLA